MSAYTSDVNFIMRSRMRENCMYGSVRGLYREVWVYSTRGGKIMIEYSNLNETFITFIIKRFPELKEQVEGEMSRLGEFLPHVILGNV